MKENKIDTLFQQEFEDRSFSPSSSAWERLENALDETQRKSKRKRLYYISAVASIALLFSVFSKVFIKKSKDNSIIPPKESIMVSAPEQRSPSFELDEVTPEFEKNIEVNSITKSTKFYQKKEHKRKPQLLKEKNQINDILIASIDKEKKEVQVENSDSYSKIEVIPSVNKTRIQVNANDLLYAVTHSPDEVKNYYASLKMSRNDLLDSIQFELNKSKLKVNPTQILAEIERTIEDEEFNGNFKQNLGKKISTIIVAIADRNN